jgi:uncharacterized membrane protein
LLGKVVVAGLLERLSHREVACSDRLNKHSLVGSHFLVRLTLSEQSQLSRRKLNNNQVYLAGLILSLAIHHFLGKLLLVEDYLENKQPNYLKHRNNRANLPAIPQR